MCVLDDTVTWPEVAARLAAARSYWLCTTMPSGSPHACPVWGVVVDHTGEDRPFLPDADPDFDVVYAIRPRSAMMWRLPDYEGSQRRWTC